MSDQAQTVICRRCGRGFVLTPSHVDFIKRRGYQVKTPLLCLTCFLKTGPLPKRQGTIKWFNIRKQYGFITTEEDQEVFFHQQQLLSDEKQPHKGQMAFFHTRQAARGPEALNVELR